ncbi:MAG: hypothetical protein IT243_00530 [Bacteroidia bacterium]|nr:hypothetical protein [Bacteroidia bacterium]
MQNNTIINLLRNDEISKFIGLHINDDAKMLAFDAKKNKDIDLKSVASLISLYQKAKKKLPEHYNVKAALNKKGFEQCTSEMVAIAKSKIINTANKNIINITGGLGVDDWAFSKNANQIISCDIDEEVNSLAKYNLELFEIKNVKRLLTDGIEYIDNIEKTDIIYADPDRRTTFNKAFRLEDCKPDVLNNINILLKKSDELWIKVSPIADISYLIRKVPQICKIYVIALYGEIKEILICCSKKIIKNHKITAINIEDDNIYEFSESEDLCMPTYNNDGKYLYDPCKSISKASLAINYARRLQLNLISDKSNLYISDSLVENFQGKKFEIISKQLYKPDLIKKYLRANKISMANITSRNFFEKAEDLWKRYKLKTGGNDFLYFTTDYENLKWMYHCKLNSYLP